MHGFAIHDAGNAKVDFGEIVNGDDFGHRLAARRAAVCAGRLGGLGRRLLGRFGGREKRLELPGFHALHEVPVFADSVAGGQALAGGGKAVKGGIQPLAHAFGQARQHGREQDGEQAKRLNAGGAHVVQAALHAGLLGQLPGLVLIDVFVHAVGQGHDFAHGLAVFAPGQQRGDGRGRILQVAQQGVAICRDFAQPAVKAFGDEAGGASGDVDVFANQIGIDAQHEIFGIEINIFIARRKLGRQVIAQPFGIHAQVQVFERIQPGATAFAHFLAIIDGEKTVNEYTIRRLAP